MKSRGFTIVELLVVIVVIGILAAIILVTYNNIQDRARYSAMLNDLKSIRASLEAYKVDNGKYPNSADCVNTAGQYNYAYRWCGWDQGKNDSFIPGLSPKYMSVTPQINFEPTARNVYLYQSQSNGGTPGTDQYQLIRYRSDGLTAIERQDTSLNLTGNGYDGIAWGYKSDASVSWW